MSQMLNSSQVLSKSFEQLTKHELYNILALRSEVFCVEQDCPYLDVDHQDLRAQHVFIKKDELVIAYARFLTDDDITFHIQRVVVDKNHRKHRLATVIMQHCIDLIKQKPQKNKNIVISAQSYLRSFYHGLGFKSTDNYYLEDDIPHECMQLDLG